MKRNFFINLMLCLLTTISVFLTSCGSEQIGTAKKGSALGETGESYSSESLPPDASSSAALRHQTEFDAFCHEVFREEMAQASTLDLHYTLLNPEAYGISQEDVSLGTFTLEDLVKSNDMIRALRDRLTAFDAALLTEEQTLIYDALLATLDTSLMSEGLELYEQPLAPTIGVQAQLPILLAEYSFHSLKDVEDYLALLSQIDVYYSQILEFQQQKAQAGLAPSDASIDKILESCESYQIDPENNFLTETFASRLAALEVTHPLSEEQKNDFHSRHAAAIREHFIPAYESLISGMTALKGRGIRDGGLSQLKNGKQYYEYLLKSGPGLSYTPAELKSALTARMEKDYLALSRILEENSDPKLLSSAFSLTDPEAILTDLKAQMADLFPALPQCGYEIRYVPGHLEDSLSPAFYLTAPLDNTDQNVIYINNGSADAAQSLYTTLAHEGFPGHLYQTIYSRTHAQNPLLSILSCSGANEGWATYVENIACTFDNGLTRQAGEYRAHLRSFSLCVHGLLDIGINYDGWTREQAGDFITSWFQADEDTVSDLWQVMIDNPTNYLEYCGGYVEYMEMRETAQSVLGEKFSDMEFHKFLLDVGPVPFSVIRSRFDRWLERLSGQMTHFDL